MYEAYYDKLQLYFCRDNLELRYMNWDSFASGIRSQNLVIDWKNLEYVNDFINLNENHELFSNKNKKFIG